MQAMPHHRGEPGGGERGGDGDGVERQPGGRQDRRIDEDDVGHRQERGDAAENLAADGGVALGELEVARDGRAAGGPTPSSSPTDCGAGRRGIPSGIPASSAARSPPTRCGRRDGCCSSTRS
jgi:hypothetical protein